MLIDRRRQAEFSPLYPDLISGRVWPRSLTMRLDRFARRCGAHFVQSPVRAVGDGRVETDQGSFEADAICLTTGCVTNWFGRTQVRRHGFGLKSNAEALRLKRELQRRYEAARDTGRPCRVLVIGGGYTGFETASHAVAQLDRLARRDSWARDVPIRVEILDKAPEVLGMVAPEIRRWAAGLLESIGVRIRTNLSVDRLDEDHNAVLTDGTHISEALVVWTAGVSPGQVTDSIDAPRRAHGRLAVDEALRVEGKEKLFAAGDVAGPLGPEGRPLRMAVQFSRLAGQQAGRNILAVLSGRAPEPFAPMDPGYVVPLAHNAGAGDILGLRTYHGPLPFYLHYLMCLLRNWTIKKRLLLLADLLDLHWTERFRRGRG